MNANSLKQTGIKFAPPIPAKLKRLDRWVRESEDCHGLLNYVECCLSEQNEYGTPFYRIESTDSLNALDASEWIALRAWLAAIEQV